MTLIFKGGKLPPEGDNMKKMKEWIENTVSDDEDTMDDVPSILEVYNDDGEIIETIINEESIYGES